MSNLNISNLSYAAIFEKPIWFDWWSNSEQWSCIIPQDQSSDNWHQFEPMMSYYYKLPYLKLSAQQAQTILTKAVLPLVVVDLDDEIVLALSDGGMDLSWEICEAYIRLGY